MAKNGKTLVITPQSVLAASNSYNLNQAILDELNVREVRLAAGAGFVVADYNNNRVAGVDDTGTANPTRFGSTRTITLNNGTFRYSANGTAASTQALMPLTVYPF